MNSIKKMMLSGALGCLISGMAYADGSSPQPVKPYWQDIQVVAVNKEKPRSSFMSYADRETALTSRFEKSPYYSLLNGVIIWKFSLSTLTKIFLKISQILPLIPLHGMI